MSSLSGRALAWSFILCFAAFTACGNSESDKKSAGGAGQTSGGAGGRSGGGAGGAMLPPGFSSTPKTISCGSNCTSATLGFGTAAIYIDPCCTGEDQNICGIDTTFLSPLGSISGMSCEPRNQPGAVDEACPTPPPAVIPTMGTTVTLDPMPGCCRADTGTCGVLVNRVTAGNGLLPLANLGLGCVDAAPFFPGQAAMTCGGGGAGGTGGAPGTGGVSGMGGAGAASGTAGDGGAVGEAGAAGGP